MWKWFEIRKSKRNPLVNIWEEPDAEQLKWAYYPYGWVCRNCHNSNKPSHRVCDTCQFKRPFLEWFFG